MKRKISIWLMTESFDRIIFSFKRKKRKGYGRCFGTMVGKDYSIPYQSKWQPYPLKPYEHENFYFLGYL
jgi:hypothetical protein